ncbi:hypothetical protein J2X76_001624 [Neorhizobium sp. 2083]|uniref:class I SAM-dependent methyltransferase n=1 Tax=Neorhizobium sp. 2083 TaxID=2817762 RepID=UPI00285DFD3E|nr:class I SAM-dependent methyltransferase [Neorhizobium sp. 2083]MDR6816451.1 hypothetical protein [Neorhizobium sp. 2083]
MTRNPTNPRNPYHHEISFDQHVWLPAANSRYRTLIDLIDDRGLIDQLIENHLNVAHDISAHLPIASKKILSSLSEADLAEVRKRLVELDLPDSHHNLITSASYFFPELRRKLRTSITNPPHNIHRMQRPEAYVGDLYSADMVASVLSLSGISFEPNQKYLDFGCSSGSLIRVLKAVAPDSSFHGVDPIPSSIDWANKNIPGAKFSVSNPRPPLHESDGAYRGVIAISIWSHLGEKEALAWFEEMYRLVESNGWLLFTAHGDTSISFYNKMQLYPPRRILALLEGLANTDFVFEEIYIGNSPEGLSAKGYGNAYFLPSWVERNLSDKWDVIYFGKAQNQENQDVYLLQKRSDRSLDMSASSDMYLGRYPFGSWIKSWVLRNLQRRR